MWLKTCDTGFIMLVTTIVDGATFARKSGTAGKSIQYSAPLSLLYFANCAMNTQCCMQPMIPYIKTDIFSPVSTELTIKNAIPTNFMTIPERLKPSQDWRL
eukprot:770244_1